MIQQATSIESRASWIAASITLAILSFSYGAPLLIVVGLKPMQDAMGIDRSVLALAGSLVWVGTGLGGILMGWLADRIGIRATVAFGGAMMAAGLALSSYGTVWALYVGHGLLIGLLGNGAIYAPLLINVTRWFDRRRGTAVALISSGQYIAGVVWPSVFERGIAQYGWQTVMLSYAAVVAAIVIPAVLLIRAAPSPASSGVSGLIVERGRKVLGMRPNVTQALLCFAGFCCCVPMSVPSSHLVAFCSDIGITPTQGAAMLSVLLGSAFVSRQFWGLMADRVGGLRTVLAGSACQAVAIGAFLLTQNEVGLFAISAAFGLGFSGIIPSYSVAIRDLFPSSEASWRIPTVLFTAMSGMAFGSWFAGALYDHFGYYAPAFATGVLFNLANLAVIGFLVSRTSRGNTPVLTYAHANS
ncbi:MAG TPA: MFS transporter [Acetobacteraceae bacterium]|nr:MFS transporter [Acetobacteraceae bacterium]